MKSPGGHDFFSFTSCEGNRQYNESRTGEWSMCNGTKKPAVNTGSTSTGSQGAIGENLYVDIKKDGRFGERVFNDPAPTCPANHTCSFSHTRTERWSIQQP